MLLYRTTWKVGRAYSGSWQAAEAGREPLWQMDNKSFGVKASEPETSQPVVKMQLLSTRPRLHHFDAPLSMVVIPSQFRRHLLHQKLKGPWAIVPSCTL